MIFYKKLIHYLIVKVNVERKSKPHNLPSFKTFLIYVFSFLIPSTTIGMIVSYKTFILGDISLLNLSIIGFLGIQIFFGFLLIDISEQIFKKYSPNFKNLFDNFEEFEKVVGYKDINNLDYLSVYFDIPKFKATLFSDIPSTLKHEPDCSELFKFKKHLNDDEILVSTIIFTLHNKIKYDILIKINSTKVSDENTLTEIKKINKEMIILFKNYVESIVSLKENEVRLQEMNKQIKNDTNAKSLIELYSKL